MSDFFIDLIDRFGYVIVAVVLFIEAIGVPIPGESAVVTAAAYAGRGSLSIVGIVISACIGTISGGMTAYWLGLRGGNAIIAHFGRVLRLDAARLEKAHAFFVKHGAKTVLLGRFVAFFRSFVGLFAGISQMPWPRFAAYNAAGGLIWVLTFSSLGYFFGVNLPRRIHDVGRVSLVLALLIALGTGIVFLWRWYNRNRAAIIVYVDTRWDRLYLTAHLAIGFAVSLLAIAMFGSITEDIVESSRLVTFDVVVATRLHESASAPVLHLLHFFSALGSRSLMTIVLIAGGLAHALRRRGLAVATWWAAFIGGSLLDVALRFVIRRSALPFADEVVAGWGTGLVSGHLLGTVVGYGMLAHLTISISKRATTRTAIVVATIVLVSAIAVSRLYLGVHYVSDEIAGLAAGMLWLMTCVSGLEIAQQRADAARRRRFTAVTAGPTA
jgi:membrane protein DedA with SNARE-associated domain/membrane-associated phospholipid phosphatase